ncbi:uncharacterized protein LOC121934634 [Sceloporus undulatus]|uniref:uncharacterized protein LOC121934634 n=1 Tax=Sceloporus undulatus TaxID=8520 RepID=UPI001C4D3D96|nr:uncharacterized protein LOC121934634 [Sceloporus undulatus]XP_042331216.1 uncharacterized protein LOC121934634 [Sceloporus undulatus]
MEVPPDSAGSKPLDEDTTPQSPNGQSKPKELNENVDENSKPQGPNEEAGEGKSLAPKEEAEDIKSQGPSEQTEEARPEEQHEKSEENGSKVQDLTEHTEDSIPEEITVVEDGKLQEFNVEAKDGKPQDLKEWADEQMKILEEKHPDEALPSISNSDNITVTEWQEELLISPIPEAKVDETPSMETEDSKPQYPKDQTEEYMLTPVGSYQGKERKSSVYSFARTRKKPIKKQVDRESNTEPRKYPNAFRNPRMPPKSPLLAQPVKPRSVDKAIQCNKLLMPRLPLPGTIPPARSLVPKAKLPPTDNKGTQISPSFERLRRRNPPWIVKKKTEDITISQVSPSKFSSSSMPQRSGNRYRKGVTSSTVARPSSMTAKKEKKFNVTYNLYINVCDDEWKHFDPGLVKEPSWEENVMSSGLAKACAVFCNIKSGRIHVSKLRPALHTLEVLVTSDEMYQTLKSVKVDESGTISFSEFLEAVNKTSPFAETDAFQNTLRAFKQMKNGAVGVDELKSVLTDLEVYMTSEEIQQTLDHTQLNKNKKVDLSKFLRAARDLQTHLEEEAFQIECSALERRPFQDVTELINAESRWRRKYRDYFDEDTSSATSLFPFLALPSSDENILLALPPSNASSKTQNLSDSQAASNNVEEEGGEPENDITGVKKSQLDITELSNVEGEEGNQDTTIAPNSQSDATEEKHEGHDDTEGQNS